MINTPAEQGNKSSGNKSSAKSSGLRIDNDYLAGDKLKCVIKMLENLESTRDRINVIYESGIEYKVIFPQMINITYVYSYYGANRALK